MQRTAILILLWAALFANGGQLKKFENSVNKNESSSSDSEDDECGFFCELWKVFVYDETETDEPTQFAPSNLKTKTKSGSVKKTKGSTKRKTTTTSTSPVGTINNALDDGMDFPTGHPGLPTLQASLVYHDPHGAVEALGADVEIGAETFVFGIRDMHYMEPSTLDTMDFGSLYAGLRVPIGKAFRFEIFGGGSWLLGDANHYGLNAGGFFQVRPIDHWLCEARGAWHGFGEGLNSEVWEGDVATELWVRFLGLRGGYHWTASEDDEVLKGPYIGATVRF